MFGDVMQYKLLSCQKHPKYAKILGFIPKTNMVDPKPGTPNPDAPQVTPPEGAESREAPAATPPVSPPQTPEVPSTKEQLHVAMEGTKAQAEAQDKAAAEQVRSQIEGEPDSGAEQPQEKPKAPAEGAQEKPEGDKKPEDKEEKKPDPIKSASKDVMKTSMDGMKKIMGHVMGGRFTEAFKVFREIRVELAQSIGPLLESFKGIPGLSSMIEGMLLPLVGGRDVIAFWKWFKPDQVEKNADGNYKAGTPETLGKITKPFYDYLGSLSKDFDARMKRYQLDLERYKNGAPGAVNPGPEPTPDENKTIDEFFSALAQKSLAKKSVVDNSFLEGNAKELINDWNGLRPTQTPPPDQNTPPTAAETTAEAPLPEGEELVGKETSTDVMGVSILVDVVGSFRVGSGEVLCYLNRKEGTSKSTDFEHVVFDKESQKLVIVLKGTAPQRVEVSREHLATLHSQANSPETKDNINVDLGNGFVFSSSYA